MMKRAVMAILGVLLFSGTGLGAYWYFWANREDPQVAEVRDLMSKMSQDDGQISDEERDAARRQIREKMENLSSEQRQQLWQGKNPFADRMNRTVDEYFELPPEERVAYLDKQIDRWEERRQEFENARRERDSQESEKGEKGEGRRNAGPPPAGGTAATNGNNTRGKSSGKNSTASRLRRLDKDGRQERQKKMLDNTSPEQRAKWSEYMDAMRQRRKERGLPDWGRRRAG